MSDFALEVRDLSKQYGSYKAVDNVSFTIPRGGIVGLLGPNGAGKTTTIQMLLGITLADSGSIRYFGNDFTANKQASLKKVNYASSFSGLGGRITVMESLIFYSTLYSVKNYKEKIKSLSERLEISNLLNKIFWELSAGQKTRVLLVKSLLNDPELLLLDEPTASLDPDISDKLLTLIEELKENSNMSILFTSHDMNEVTRLCDTVIFLDKGTVIAQDTPDELVKRIPFAEIELSIKEGGEKVIKFLETKKLSYKQKHKGHLLITCGESEVPKTIFGISKVGSVITDIEIHKPTLEDFFLSIARK